MRAWLYDLALVPMTARWYRAVLERVPKGARVLDVGIGTGAALAANAALVRTRSLQVTGIDVDAGYLARCRANVARAGLATAVSLRHAGLHDLVASDGPFDAVYFSGSFMMFDDPAAALRRALTLVSANGLLYFTQTFEERRSRALEWLKPRLHWLTTVRFGHVTYRRVFVARLDEAGLEIIEDAALPSRRPGARLVVARAVSPPSTDKC